MAHGAPFIHDIIIEIIPLHPSYFSCLYLITIRLDRYHEADIRTGEATHWQLTSLQAFWPGVQVCFTPYMVDLPRYYGTYIPLVFSYCYHHHQTLLGDVAAANLSHREFYNVWQRFGVLPERYLYLKTIM
jgi:hypothetical protein